MEPMSFGGMNPELLPGARNAVETCLAVQPGERVALIAECGRLVAARCARADLEREFWAYCHTDENSNRVGELAFGTNLGLSEMIGVLLQDEKLPGVHIAFGDPYGSQTRADWASRTHVDVLTRRCDAWIDGEQIIAKGRYLLDRLGMAQA